MDPTVIVGVHVDAIVSATVIVAVHLNGNATLIVIPTGGQWTIDPVVG